VLAASLASFGRNFSSLIVRNWLLVTSSGVFGAGLEASKHCAAQPSAQLSAEKRRTTFILETPESASKAGSGEKIRRIRNERPGRIVGNVAASVAFRNGFKGIIDQ
jgi:hypothetical protein